MKIKGILAVLLGLSLVLGGNVRAADEPAEADVEDVDISDEDMEDKGAIILADLDFVVDARPASLLVDAEGDSFQADGVTLSTVFMMPNVSAGVGMEIERLYVDLIGGAGMILNDRFRSFLLQAIVSATYEFTESFNFGPRLGLVYFPDPEWLENDDVDFDASAGLLAGLHMWLGDRIAYVVSVDLIMVEFDASSRPGVILPDDTLDFFGITFQFGVRGEF